MRERIGQSLATLPEEALDAIARCANPEDLAALRSTCKTLARICGPLVLHTARICGEEDLTPFADVFTNSNVASNVVGIVFKIAKVKRDSDDAVTLDTSSVLPSTQELDRVSHEMAAALRSTPSVRHIHFQLEESEGDPVELWYDSIQDPTGPFYSPNWRHQGFNETEQREINTFKTHADSIKGVTLQIAFFRLMATHVLSLVELRWTEVPYHAMNTALALDCNGANADTFHANIRGLERVFIGISSPDLDFHNHRDDSRFDEPLDFLLELCAHAEKLEHVEIEFSNVFNRPFLLEEGFPNVPVGCLKRMRFRNIELPDSYDFEDEEEGDEEFSDEDEEPADARLVRFFVRHRATLERVELVDIYGGEDHASFLSKLGKGLDGRRGVVFLDGEWVDSISNQYTYDYDDLVVLLQRA